MLQTHKTFLFCYGRNSNETCHWSSKQHYKQIKEQNDFSKLSKFKEFFVHKSMNDITFPTFQAYTKGLQMATCFELIMATMSLNFTS
jgi:hypothetical protein